MERSETSAHVVLCLTRPSRVASERFQKCKFIYIDGSIPFTNKQSVPNGTCLGEFLSKDEYKSIDDKISRQWHSLCSSANDATEPEIRHIKYVYIKHLTPIAIFERSLELALKTYNPQRITFLESGSSQINRASLNTLYPHDLESSFIEWAAKKTISRLAKRQGARIDFYIDSNNFARSSNSRSLINSNAEYLINILGRLSNYTYRAILELISNFTIKRTQKNRKRILLITQKPKSFQLRCFLKGIGIPFKNMSLEEFYCFLGIEEASNKPEYQLQLPKDKDNILPDIFLKDWMIQMTKNQERFCRTAFKRYFRMFDSPLMTDAEHSAIVNRLSQEINAYPGWIICSLPEGGMSNFSQTDASHSVFEDHQSLVRGFGSQIEESDFSSCHQAKGENFICGYGTALSSCHLLAPLVRRFITLKHFQRKNKKIAYVNAPFIYPYWWTSRTTHEPVHNKYRAMYDLIGQLLLGDYLIVASARGCTPNFMELFSDRIYFSNLNWSILASASDICIVSDSSIGPEILNLSRPVLKWTPDYFVSLDPFYYLTELGVKNFKEVKNVEEILPSADELIQKLCAQREGPHLNEPNYQMYAKYFT